MCKTLGQEGFLWQIRCALFSPLLIYKSYYLLDPFVTISRQQGSQWTPVYKSDVTPCNFLLSSPFFSFSSSSHTTNSVPGDKKHSGPILDAVFSYHAEAVQRRP